MTLSNTKPMLLDLEWAGQPVRIEAQWVGASPTAQPEAPLVIFLHEGLGSLAMWKEFPANFCQATGSRGLVYSRPGYGQSNHPAGHAPWPVDFMHAQALDVLPALLTAVGVTASCKPFWLLGHSDGASIALIFAAAFPNRVAGVMALAPHIMVEDLTLQSIEQARLAYLHTDLPKKLARYHADADLAFWGWNRVWLNPAFKAWSIEAELARIGCPVLAVQGLDDDYGTLAQIHGIAQRVLQTTVLELAHCGHSPHRDQPQALISRAQLFMQQHTGDNP